MSDKLVEKADALENQGDAIRIKNLLALANGLESKESVDVKNARVMLRKDDLPDAVRGYFETVITDNASNGLTTIDDVFTGLVEAGLEPKNILALGIRKKAGGLIWSSSHRKSDSQPTV